jgi:hypothetical protein
MDKQAHTTSKRAQLFALVDGAVAPARIQPLLEQSGVEFWNVYAGLPEEAVGPAALFLAPIANPDADWFQELDRIDQHSPCLSLVWSRVGPVDLVTHLQAFLFTHIGDGMTAMIRFFDPRATGAVFRIWGDEIFGIFIHPIERWMYRGRHQNWQRVENDSLSGARICRSIQIELEPADIDVLVQHAEPDQLLSQLTELGLIEADRPYLDRMNDFMPRYHAALQWELTDIADRLLFCHHTYRYGVDFDSHPRMRDVLTARKVSGRSFSAMIDVLPAYVWRELVQRRQA